MQYAKIAIIEFFIFFELQQMEFNNNLIDSNYPLVDGLWDNSVSSRRRPNEFCLTYNQF